MMKSKALLLAGALLAVGTQIGNAAVLLNPGEFALLGQTIPSAALSAVAWDGTTATAVLIEDASPFGAYGYFVNAAGGTVAASMQFDAAPVHIGATALAPGGTYYLGLSDDLLLAGASFTNPTYTSEPFTLVPEPATYGALAALGLLGFAGFRRFRA